MYVFPHPPFPRWPADSLGPPKNKRIAHWTDNVVCSCGIQVFLNIVLDEAVEEKPGGERQRLGMVVIRGNSVVMLEALERMGDDRR